MATLLLKQKIGEWGDPLTPPESKTECNGWNSGDWPWGGGGWKTCVSWGTQWRHMEVEAFLEIYGPDDLNADAHSAVASCLNVAVAAAVAAIPIGIATDGAGCVAAAMDAFTTCLEAKGIEELAKYSCEFKTDAGWTDWA